jgi:CheY-like chemotaxis protein
MNTKTILIVDDDDNTRSLLHHILKLRWDIILMEAGDGKQALDLINGGVMPDLCIVDLMMPVLDGRSLIEQMYRRQLLKSIKVVTCSAINEYHARQDLMSLGTCGHICKPIESQDVLDIIARTLHLGVAVQKSIAPISTISSQAAQSMASTLIPSGDCRRRYPFSKQNPPPIRLNVNFNN